MTSHTYKISEPLLVRPRDAWRMLGCGNTRGYQLLALGELESFLDGRARKITVASIHDYIARGLAAAGATKSEPPRRGQRVGDLRDLIRGNRPPLPTNNSKVSPSAIAAGAGEVSITNRRQLERPRPALGGDWPGGARIGKERLNYNVY